MYLTSPGWRGTASIFVVACSTQDFKLLFVSKGKRFAFAANRQIGVKIFGGRIRNERNERNGRKRQGGRGGVAKQILGFVTAAKVEMSKEAKNGAKLIKAAQKGDVKTVKSLLKKVLHWLAIFWGEMHFFLLWGRDLFD